MIIHTNK